LKRSKICYRGISKRLNLTGYLRTFNKRLRCFGEYTNKIILNSSLYFPAIKQINDPFDCKLSFQQEYSLAERVEYFTQFADKDASGFTLEQLLEKYPDNQSFINSRNVIIKKLINKLGLLSLSKNPKNILMWTHYSNNHTGLVFQFTFGASSECFQRPLLVDYKDEYELLSYTSDFKEEAPKLMLTKHTGWTYESEVRVIDLDYQGEKKFKKHELTSIIFGALTKDKDIDEMINLCNINGFNHVSFSQARLNSSEFSLEFCEILKNSVSGSS
jgi:hypothetical protein